MRKRRKRWLCLVSAVALLSGMFTDLPVHATGSGGVLIQSEVTSGGTMKVWVQDAADRAFESSPVPENPEQEIRLYAARNEYEAAQVMVRSTESMEGLTVTASELCSEGGDRISTEHITIYSEYSAPAAVGGDVEATPDGSNRYTDALLPNQPVDVAADITQPYWVRVYVPKDQAAGTYTGTITVTAGEEAAVVPVSVKVYDVAIPDTNESNFKMINWFSSAGIDFATLESSVSYQYDCKLYDENWWKVMENFAKDLAIHRNNVIFIDAEAFLLPDSTLLPEDDTREPYVNGDDNKMAAGKYLLDWNRFDRMMDIFIQAGAMQYLYLPGNSKIYRASDGQMKIFVMEYGENSMTRIAKNIYTDQENGIVNPKAEEYVKVFYTALRSHMESRYADYLNKVYVSALDEPSTEVQNMASNWYYKTVRTVYPETYSNEAHNNPSMKMTESTTLCPVLNLYEDYQGYYQEQLSEGKELWYYTCIGPQGNALNRFIPYHLIKTRLIPWYAFKINATGYLHWGWSYWGMNDTLNSLQTGDEWLVRPDKENYDVFTSVRNEAQLDGLEDYELLTLLAQKDEAAAEKIVNTLISSATYYIKDGDILVSAHKAILDRLTGEEAGEIAIEIFRDQFENGYDYAWKRDTAAPWSVSDGKYNSQAASISDDSMTTLREQTIANGEILVTMEPAEVYGNNADAAWTGVTFRKTNLTDDAFASGYTAYIRKNGSVELYRAGDNFAMLGTAEAQLEDSQPIKMKIAMNGNCIKVFVNDVLMIDAEDTTAVFEKGFVGLTSNGSNVAYSDFRLFSYDGMEQAKVSAELEKDLSYRDSFTAANQNWGLEGNAQIEDGKLYLSSATANLLGQIFTDCEVSFCADMSAGETDDAWAGLIFGRKTAYGEITRFGGYRLLVFKSGYVALLDSTGANIAAAMADGKLKLTGTVDIRVVCQTGEMAVYLNNAENPVLRTDIAADTEGFIALNAGGGRIPLDDFAVTGVRETENGTLLDDFSGDLSNWIKAVEPDRITIEDGMLKMTGVTQKEDPASPGIYKGVSPAAVYSAKTFENVRIGFDVRLDQVARELGDWAGIFLHSGGTEGFWKSGGYLVYVDNFGTLDIYKTNGSIGSTKIKTDPTQQSIHLEVKIENGVISVYVDYAKEPVLSVEDSQFRSGYFGLCTDFADAVFDNVTCEDLGKCTLPEEPEETTVWDEAYTDDFTTLSDVWKVTNSAYGTMACMDNKLALNSNDGSHPLLAALTGHAYTSMELSVQTTIPTGTSGGAGIAFGRKKWDDSIWDNGYFLHTYYDATKKKVAIELFLANVGGAGFAEVDCERDAVTTLRVRVTNKTIKVFFGEDPEPVITYHDENYEGGYVALCAYVAGCKMDDFSVKHIEDEPEEPDDKVVWNQPFADDFEGNLDGWQILNYEWAAGKIECRDGKLYVTCPNDGSMLATPDKRAYTSMDASVDVSIPTGAGWAALTFGREIQGENIWTTGTKAYIAYLLYDDATGKLIVDLFKCNVGFVQSASFDWEKDRTVTLRVRVVGKEISVYAGEGTEPIIVHRDDAYEGGFVAIGTYYASCSFDNFKIDTIAGEGYTASVTGTSYANVGDTVNVKIQVQSDEFENFASAEVKLNYDAEKLAFQEEASVLNGAAVRNDALKGALVLEDYGEAQALGDAYVLAFTAKEKGEAVVTLTGAAFSNQKAAESKDLMEADLENTEITMNITLLHHVKLAPIFKGDSFIEDGLDYTFSLADDAEHYDYDSITASMGGSTVEVIRNADGTYTVKNVTGDLEITGARSAKSYTVTIQVTGEEDRTASATYGVDYTWSMPTDTAYTYSLTVKYADDTNVPYTSENGVITVAGTDITQDFTITVVKKQVPPTLAKVTVEGNAASDVTYENTAVPGTDYTFTVAEDERYDYTVTAKNGETLLEVTVDEDGRYTIVGSAFKAGDSIVITVNKIVKPQNVNVTKYLTLNGAQMWLIRVETTKAEDVVYSYRGQKMFWSEQYGAYCYLMISADEQFAVTGDDLAILTGTAEEIRYDMDINDSGKVDANDAQLIYNMYNVHYTEFTESVTMAKFLRADVNADAMINVEDAAAVIHYLLR